KDTPILNQINKGGKQKGLWKNINNLAWDLSAVRFMERMFTMRERGDYMIPFFFSFDNKLRYFIRAFPAKAVIIDRISEGVVSIPGLNTWKYLKQEGCADITASFFSAEKMSERFAKIRTNPDVPLISIRSEYKLLRAALLRAN
ncbi:MAG: hypothetical protein HW402_421, partial [Dehalococcoidales bacterium]|nr:hypothetical protein [Dehalococcoidales bacterium]